MPIVYTWADLVSSGGLGGELQHVAGAPAEGDTI